MKGYYVLVCSASWALGRVGKHNFNPLGAAQSTALSSGQWIIYLIVDKPKMSGSQHLLINHSLQGSGGNHGRHLNHWRAMFCTSNRSVSWWTAEWDCSLCAIPQHIFTSTITYWVCTNCIPTGKSASSHTIFLISCKACRLRTDDSNTVVQNAVLKVTLIKKKMEGEKAAFTEMNIEQTDRCVTQPKHLHQHLRCWIELSSIYWICFFLSSDILTDLNRVEMIQMCMGQTKRASEIITRLHLISAQTVQLAWGVSTNTHVCT